MRLFYRDHHYGREIAPVLRRKACGVSFVAVAHQVAGRKSGNLFFREKFFWTSSKHLWLGRRLLIVDRFCKDSSFLEEKGPWAR